MDPNVEDDLDFSIDSPSEAPEAPILPEPDATIATRGYQQEMLDESLKGNVIIAMPTGSGKTHIAVLRMRVEVEREPRKVCWFTAPTVALCEQQKRVIQGAIPVSVALISGANDPDHWRDASLWKRVLATNRIVVSTPQVLLDALSHGHIKLGRDIALLVLDEAHHATKNHPYRLIMVDFYKMCPPRNPALDADMLVAAPENVRPHILGLTASPIYGGDVKASFDILEANLDARIRAPLRTQAELDKHVFKPTFRHVFYDVDSSGSDRHFSTNLEAIKHVFESLDIEADPYVQFLRKQLATTSVPAKYNQIDQKLSKTIANKTTYVQKAIGDVYMTGMAICADMGAWAADWFVWAVVTGAKDSLSENQTQDSLKKKERHRVLEILKEVSENLTEPSYYDEDVVEGSSYKVAALVSTILVEKQKAEEKKETWNSIVFVQRREAVLALQEVLANHPQTREFLRIAPLVGTSDTASRTPAVDITKALNKTQDASLDAFKLGEKNLVISTAVAEEGIDIQACGSVIRWDPPQNMTSWLQSRGRARRQQSTFTLLVNNSERTKTMKDWAQMEKDMIEEYSNAARHVKPDLVDPNDIYEPEELVYKVESTGAMLTLHSAVSHLNQFCAVIPSTSNIDHVAVYELDPPEFVEGWHQNQAPRPIYQGPWGAKVTLPRRLPPHLRSFETARVHRSKGSAVRHAAFKAYKTLHEQGLLNDSLLPLTSITEPELENEVKEILKQVERRDGTATVSAQMDPWLPVGDQWFQSELCISGMPPLRLFTLSLPMELCGPDSPILHRPEGQQVVSWIALPGSVEPDIIERARDYTRRLLWTMNGSRMQWEQTDFAYLVLPWETTTPLSQKGNYAQDAVWDERRAWYATQTHAKDKLLCNLAAFVDQFAHVDDLAIVRNGPQFAKPYKFVRWRMEPLEDEEEEELLKMYSRCSDIEVAYPLVVAQPLPPRSNFLVPMPPGAKPFNPKPLHLLTQLTHLSLTSQLETQYAFLLPSVFRALAIALTVNTMRETMLAGTDLYHIPLKMLTTALCAPSAQEQYNYERMETLGDTVLKFMVSLQLLGEYPLWHEGYLTQKMGHSVSNVKLAKANIKHGLYKWIIRDRTVSKKWKPKYLAPVAMEPAPEEEEDVEVEPEATPRRKNKKEDNQELSTKVLADVVEALIGAAYLHGSFELALQFGQLFDLGVKWQPLPARVDSILRNVDPPTELPAQLDNVETMLGYTFDRKLLLVEALTHSSYHADSRTISYERLEFCGDAVLDMVVSDFLYRSDREYTPGRMFHRKSAMVNMHTLAFFCLSTALELPASQVPRPDPATRKIVVEETSRTVRLYQSMLHSSGHILLEQDATFKRYERRRAEIEAAMQGGDVFPWAPLFLLQAPKFFSDIMESLLGAVYLDSGGSFDAVRGVLRHIGFMALLERVVAEDVDVLHPVSRLHMWASKKHVEVDYIYAQADGNISCTIAVNGEPKEDTRAEDKYLGRMTKLEVRLSAAHKANSVCDSWVLVKKRKRTESDIGEPTETIPEPMIP
ncbi:hypothetical protein MKEN_00352200 [Mycena kentingensis (nom. inval.)]|nr:hypothetical protein MKEN_00352200 [Mycena kentingensis (nom. inval.)]